MRVAAVDVGTNSVRLLVAEPSADASRHLLQVDRRMEITRLGKGIDATGHLDEKALDRTVAAITSFAQAWKGARAERVRITATSAIRDAEDRERFFTAVRDATGVDAEVLTGEEEAAAAFAGATAGVRAAGATPPFVVLDIGGGSTELILGDADTDRPLASTSRQIGCVRMTERLLDGDPPTQESVEAAVAFAKEELDAAVAELRLADGAPVTVIGVAGTATTVAALHLGLDAYEPSAIHGTRVPRAAVHGIAGRLTAMQAVHLAQLGPMAPGREDVIVGGVIVLCQALVALDADEVLVSEADILDGLALGLLPGMPC